MFVYRLKSHVADVNSNTQSSVRKFDFITSFIVIEVFYVIFHHLHCALADCVCEIAPLIQICTLDLA